MQPTTDRFRAALKGSHTVVARAGIMRGGQLALLPDGITPAYLNIEDGQVVIDAAATVRTSGSITAVDPTGILTPESATDLLSPFDCELAVQRGVAYSDGTTEFIQLGLLRLKDLQIDDSSGGVTISANLLDRSAKAQGDSARAYVIQALTPVENAIQGLLSSRFAPFTYNLTATGFHVGPLVIAAKSDDWKEAASLATSAGQQLYVDRQGGVVLAPATLSVSFQSVWVFDENLDSDFANTVRTVTADALPNVIVVNGTAPGFPGIHAEAWDNDPTSPTYRYGTYGEVVKTYDEPRITTQAQAEAMAQALLVQKLSPAETVEFDAVPNAALDANDTVTVNRARIGLNNTQVVVSKLTIPLTVHAGSLMHVVADRNVLLPGTLLNEPPVIVIGGGGGTPQLPNLTVTSISWSGALSPADGDSVVFSAVVTNTGTAPTDGISPIRVAFLVDNVLQSWEDGFTGVIPPGGSVTLTANNDVNGGTGTYTAVGDIAPIVRTVRGWVDDLNTITELDETDNTFDALITIGAIVAALPDMIVTGVTWTGGSTPPAPGDHLRFRATVKNNGAAKVPDGIVIGIQFDINGTLVNFEDTYSSTPGLAPGASVTLDATGGGPAGVNYWTVPAFPAGVTSQQYTLQAWVNDVRRFQESNFLNNTLSIPLNVGIAQPTSPDLVVVGNPRPSSLTPTAGDHVTFGATIKNQGTGPTPAGTIVGVAYQIAGATVAWTDNYAPNPGLAPGASVDVVSNGGPNGVPYWVAPTPTGAAAVVAVNLDGTTQYLTAPDTPGLSITGDLSLIFGGSPVTWTPAVDTDGVNKMNPAINQRSYRMFLQAGTGNLVLRISTDGANTFDHVSTVAVSTALGTGPGYVAVRYVANNGAAGSDAHFFTSLDGITYTALGATVTVGGGAHVPFDCTSPLQIAGPVGSTNDINLFAAQVWSGNFQSGGTLRANFQASALNNVTPFPYTDPQGNVWSFNGNLPVALTTGAATQVFVCRAVVDDVNRIVESNEGNNISSTVNITVSSTGTGGGGNPPPPPPTGLAVGFSTSNQTLAYSEYCVDQALATGMKWIREEVHADTVNGGTYPDALLDYANSKGINVLFLMMNTTHVFPSGSDAAMGNACVTLHNRYKPGGTHPETNIQTNQFEIWNEPDLASVAPATYAAQCKTAWGIIKANDATTLVYGPASTPFGTGGMAAYVSNVISAWNSTGGGFFFDGVSIHPYVSDFDSGNIGVTTVGSSTGITAAIDAVRAVLDGAGHTTVPVIISEVGVAYTTATGHTNGSPATQQTMIVNYLNLVLSGARAWLTQIFFHTPGGTLLPQPFAWWVGATPNPVVASVTALLQVSAPAKPDLVPVGAPVAVPSAPTVGQAVQFSEVVKNQGTGPTDGTPIVVEFDVDGVSAVTGTAAGATTVFPLSLHSSGRYLVDAVGNPFNIIGDAAWFLPQHLSTADMDTWLTDRKNRGINAVAIGATMYDDYKTFDGISLFFSSGTTPATGFANSDFTLPNPAYWTNRFKHFLDKALSLGILVMVGTVDIASFGVTVSAWLTRLNTQGTGVAQTYGTNLATTYSAASYPNVIWGISANDFIPDAAQVNHPGSNWNPLVTAIATGLRSVDTTRIVYAGDIITDPLNVAAWTFQQLAPLYTYDPPGFYARTEWARVAPKPVFGLEYSYLGEDNGGSGTVATAASMRRAWWWQTLQGAIGGMFTGGPGAAYGKPGAGSPVAAATLAGAHLPGLTNASKFLRSRPFQNLVPDLTHTILTNSNLGSEYAALGMPPAGSDASSNLLSNVFRVGAFTSGDSGGLASFGLVYFPDRTNPAAGVTIDMTKLKPDATGKITARWLDPSNFVMSNVNTPSTYPAGPGAGTHVFLPGTANAAGTNDWVLVFETNPLPDAGLTSGSAVALAPGATVTVAASSTWPATVNPASGPHQVTAKVDPANAISESLENNNVSPALTVNVPGNPPPPPPGGFIKGISTGYPASAAPDNMLSAADLTRWTDLGVKMVRFDFPQGIAQATLDGLVNSVPAGISIMGILIPNSAAETPANAATWASGIVTRYKAKVKFWEFWNEPNIGGAGGAPRISIAAYFAQSNAVYTAVKAADATATFLVGGSVPKVSATDPNSPQSWINGGYSNGMAGHFDGITYHPYDGNASLSGLSLAAFPTTWPEIDNMTAQHNILAAHGDGAKLIWATECGWATGGAAAGSSGITVAQQGQAITNMFNKLKALASAGVAWNGCLYYSQRDRANGGSVREDTFGLVTNAGVQKSPGYATYKAYV